MKRSLWLFAVLLLLAPHANVPSPPIQDNLLLGYVGDCCGQDQAIAVDPYNSSRIVVAAGSYYWYSLDKAVGSLWISTLEVHHICCSVSLGQVFVHRN